MAPSTFSLSLFAPFLRRSKKYKKLETEEPEKRKQEEAIDELTRINSKIVRIFYLFIIGIHKSARRYSISIFLYSSPTSQPAAVAGPSSVIIFLSR